MYKVAQLKPQDDDEYNAWKQLKACDITAINKYIHNIDINSNEPFKYTVVTDTEIPIYLCSSNVKYGNLGNFKNATCSKFRADGEMVVVGTKTGEILLLAIAKMGNIIRKLSAHTGAINKIEYMYKYDLVQKYTASVGDDGTLQVWDINDQVMLHKFSESNAPLRALALHKHNVGIIATGSMDGFIRLYNIEKSSSMLIAINTQMPVNCLLFPLEIAPEIILSAGKSSIQLWDVGNIRIDEDNLPIPVKSRTPHHMNIMDMCISDGLYSGETVVFTAGLDGLVKVISLGDFREIFKYEYCSSLVAIRVLPHSQYLIVAGSDTSDSSKGHIYTRRLETGETKNEVETKHQRLSGIEHQTIIKLSEKYNEPNKSINVIEHNSKVKLAKFDKLIKKHKHRVAFSFVLRKTDPSKTPEYWQKVIRELDSLGCLKKVVAKRSSKELAVMLKMMRRFIFMPRFTNTLQRLLNVILSSYPYQEIMGIREFTHLRVVMNSAVERFRKLDKITVDIKNFLISCETNSPESFAKVDFCFPDSEIMNK